MFMLGSRCPVLSILLVCAASSTVSAGDPYRAPIDIGSRKQLFVDDAFMAVSHGVRRVMNPPVPTNQPVLANDITWEGIENPMIGYFASVIQDDDKIRVYGCGASSLPVRLEPGGPIRGLMSYAESENGIHFRKAPIDLPELKNGIPENVPRGLSLNVWIDPHAPRHQRYKAQGPGIIDVPPDVPEGEGWKYKEFHVYASADGYDWTLLARSRIGDLDTQSIIMWDEPLRRYVMYTRKWHRFGDRGDTPHERAQPNSKDYRMIRRLETDDFERWDNDRIVFAIDEVDLATHRSSIPQLPVDYYGGAVFRYPDPQGVFILMPQAHWHWKNRPADQVWRPDWPKKMKAQNLAPALVDTRLAVSRDGLNFERVGDRKPFLRPGLAGTFSSQRVWAMPDPVRMGDELWIYYVGKNRDKDNFLDPAATEYRTGLDRAIMRLDGFVSADADYLGGEIITPLLTFAGRRLELNVDTGGGGSIRVELLDEDNNPIEGFALADATELCGNSVRMAVSWGEKSDVTSLAGKPIKLRFVMQDCKLYAFQFKE